MCSAKPCSTGLISGGSINDEARPLKQPSWLPIREGVVFKVSTILFKALNRASPN